MSVIELLGIKGTDGVISLYVTNKCEFYSTKISTYFHNFLTILRQYVFGKETKRNLVELQERAKRLWQKATFWWVLKSLRLSESRFLVKMYLSLSLYSCTIRLSAEKFSNSCSVKFVSLEVVKRVKTKLLCNTYTNWNKLHLIFLYPVQKTNYLYNNSH